MSNPAKSDATARFNPMIYAFLAILSVIAAMLFAASAALFYQSKKGKR